MVGKPFAAAVAEFQAPESVTRINAGQKFYTFLWRRLIPTGGSMREHLNPVECRFVLIVDAPRDNMSDDQMKIRANDASTNKISGDSAERPTGDKPIR